MAARERGLFIRIAPGWRPAPRVGSWQPPGRVPYLRKVKSMKEEELLEALVGQASRVGVRPVLSLLLDRVCMGMYLEIFTELCDMIAEVTDGGGQI